MCLVVINTLMADIEPGRSRRLAARVGDLVNRARTKCVPVAHLCPPAPGSIGAIRVPIGRYEPVFQTHDQDGAVPDGLIDFIMASASGSIQLIGAGSERRFNELKTALNKAGFETEIEPDAMIAADLED